METFFKYRFPYEGPTNTITPYHEVDKQLFEEAQEAQRLFPERLEASKRYQQNIGTYEVLKELIQGSEAKIQERNSTSAVLPINSHFPHFVTTGFRILPVFSEIAAVFRSSVYNASSNQEVEREFEFGVRVEIPTDYEVKGEVKISIGILNIPSSHIVLLKKRKELFNSSLEELKNDVRLRILGMRSVLNARFVDLNLL